MAYVNTYIQLYTAIILAIILAGNFLFVQEVRQKSVTVFYIMLVFGITMLLAGSADNFLLLPISKDRPILDSLMAGISDISYLFSDGGNK